MLANLKVPEVRLRSLEGKIVSIAETKLQGRQQLATQFLTDLKNSSVEDPENVASIDVFAGDLDGDPYLDLSDLTGGPDFSSLVITFINYGLLREACWVVTVSVPSLVSHLFSVASCGMEAMRGAS